MTDPVFDVSVSLAMAAGTMAELSEALAAGNCHEALELVLDLEEWVTAVRVRLSKLASD